MAPAPTDTTTVSAAVAHRLAHANLLEVFSNRDPASRMAAVKATYHSDVVFYEPDLVVTGHEAVDERARILLNQRVGWEFVPDGPVKKNHNMIYLAWGFGPKVDGKVDVKTTGADVLIVKEDKITKFWVVLDGPSDVEV